MLSGTKMLKAKNILYQHFNYEEYMEKQEKLNKYNISNKIILYIYYE